MKTDNIGYVNFYYPNGNIKSKGEGCFLEGEDFNKFKDTLFFYNEDIDGKIDSMEIFKDGKRQQTIDLSK